MVAPAPLVRLRLRGTLPLLAITVLVFGIAQGMLRTADFVASEATSNVLTHVRGKVAGATVAVGPGNVSVRVVDSTAVQEYLVAVPGAISVFNMLRLAQNHTALNVVTHEDGTNGAVTVLQVSGQTSAAGYWHLQINGQETGSLDTNVVPGDTVSLVR